MKLVVFIWFAALLVVKIIVFLRLFPAPAGLFLFPLRYFLASVSYLSLVLRRAPAPLATRFDWALSLPHLPFTRHMGLAF